MGDDEPFSDDIDLAELELIEQSRRKSRSETPTAKDSLKVDISEIKELKSQLLRVQGENAILRSNLDKTARQHEDKIRDMVLTQSKRKDDMSELSEEITSLKKELERLKTERKFLANEVQDVSLQAKRERARAAAATQQNTAPEASAPSHSPVNTTPTKSPSKKRLRKDMEASFRDGFDNFLLSPTNRKRKQEMAARMAATEEQMDAQVHGDNHDNALPTRTSQGSWGSYLEEELRAQRRLVQFHRIVEEHYMPNHSQRSLEILDMYPLGHDSRLFANTSYSPAEAPVSDNLRRALTNPHEPILCFVKQCISALECYLERATFAPSCVTLAFIRTAIEFEPRAILQPDDSTKVLEALLKLLQRVIDKTVPSVLILPTDVESFKVGAGRDVMLLMYALDVLETVTTCCAFDRALQRDCWRLVPFEMIRSLLAPVLPTNIVAKAVVILTASVSDAHIGHVNAFSSKSLTTSVGTHVDRQVNEEIQLLDAIARLLIEPRPRSPAVMFASLCDYVRIPYPITLEKLIIGGAVWYLDWGVGNKELLLSASVLVDDELTIILATLILRFLLAVVIRHEVAVVAGNQSLLSALVDMLSSEMTSIYQQSFNSPLRVTLVSQGVRLLYAIWRLHANSTAILNLLPASVSHELVVFLARVALSDGPDGTALFDASIVDSARDMLEESMTVSEADDVFLSMRPA